MTSPLIIDDVDYEPLIRKLEANTNFFKGQSWDEMFNSVLKALVTMKSDIFEVLKSLEKRRKNYAELGGDTPTDLEWILSLIFVIRTIGMVYSKSTNEKNSIKNQLSHDQLLERYTKALCDIPNIKRELLELFPH